MRGEDSAFAALGLRPGAGHAEVDEAYRRLIKLYHPDRTGGDASRAAEINRAYTLLRRQPLGEPRPRRAVSVPVRPPRRQVRGRRASWILAVGIVLVAGGTIVGDPPRDGRGRFRYVSSFQWAAPVYPPVTDGAVMPLTSFDVPLQTAMIQRSVADALKFQAVGDSAATAAYSRDCHNKLRNEPTLAWFDACVAFDEATAELQEDNPLAESGPFNSSSVTARQIAAARLLTNDMMTADSRLHQIRIQVELVLLPKLVAATTKPPQLEEPVTGP